jgi:hypothetical protein
MGPFAGCKRGRGVTLTTHHHLVPNSRMSRSYTFFPQAPSCRVVGLLYFTFIITRLSVYLKPDFSYDVSEL